MEDSTKIPSATQKRLPIYLRILKEHEEKEYISSTAIAEMLDISSIQVRKDLSAISRVSGTSKKGFKINDLIKSIEEFMGVGNSHTAVIVGAGKLGQALLHHSKFDSDTKIIFAFDSDESKCDGKEILNLDRLEEIVGSTKVDIGIITTPKETAQYACDRLVSSGVKAIWNFAPTILKVPEKIVVKNEDLGASLLLLAKQLEFKED
jgi:redox-sensing transcriptional repressor